MKATNALALLAALAQETRLSIFRALVQAGPEGLAAGRIAEGRGMTAPQVARIGQAVAACCPPATGKSRSCP